MLKRKKIASKNIDFFTSTSETDENIFIFVFISSFISFGDGIDVRYFVDVVRNQTSKSSVINENLAKSL